MSPRAILIGLPGTGKSTTGRRLAKILGTGFADTDELVEAASGQSVPELFAGSGEAAFRAAEALALESALRSVDGILALGGGALDRPENRAAVADAGVPIVLLRARLETLVSRVGTAGTRPLLAADPPARLAELADRRAHVYASCAAFAVDTDGRTAGQVAAQIAARLHERAAAR